MNELGTLVDDRHVVVCCGTGGVGKTTIAATLAIEGARRGRRVLVMTVDPSKRLADSLGLDPSDSEARAIPRSAWDPDGDATPGGHLDGLVLDTAATFDGLVARYSATDEQRDRILTNRFYRNIAGALSGTQEYMAMEQLHEQHEGGRYDLIVVDTPPTRHALDFLERAARLTRLLDNRVFRLLITPARRSWRVAGAALQQFVRRVGTVIGTEVVDDVVAFFRAFEGMEDGFRARAVAVRQLVADEGTTFVLVTTPRPDAVDEVEYFAARLAERSLRVAALVVNRVHPSLTSATDAPQAEGAAASWRQRAADLRARGEQAGPAAVASAEHLDLLARYADLATRERVELVRVAERFGADSIATVELLPYDVHGFATLAEVARRLFALAS